MNALFALNAQRSDPKPNSEEGDTAEGITAPLSSRPGQGSSVAGAEKAPTPSEQRTEPTAVATAEAPVESSSGAGSAAAVKKEEPGAVDSCPREDQPKTVAGSSDPAATPAGDSTAATSTPMEEDGPASSLEPTTAGLEQNGTEGEGDEGKAQGEAEKAGGAVESQAMDVDAEGSTEAVKTEPADAAALSEIEKPAEEKEGAAAGAAAEGGGDPAATGRNGKEYSPREEAEKDARLAAGAEENAALDKTGHYLINIPRCHLPERYHLNSKLRGLPGAPERWEPEEEINRFTVKIKLVKDKRKVLYSYVHPWWKTDQGLTSRAERDGAVAEIKKVKDEEKAHRAIEKEKIAAKNAAAGLKQGGVPKVGAAEVEIVGGPRRWPCPPFPPVLNLIGLLPCSSLTCLSLPAAPARNTGRQGHVRS